MRSIALVSVAALAVILIATLHRPLLAWWDLDRGDLAFVRGDDAAAAATLADGLALEPGWRTLLEDHARAVLDADPSLALDELRRADCGEPCVAEEGDAQSRLGDERAAVDDYLAAHAVQRVTDAAVHLADRGRLDDAIALERDLAGRLNAGMLDQADLATSYEWIGTFDARAARHRAPQSRRYERDAIASFHRASALAPFNEGYLLSLGYAEADWGDRRAARAAFERVLDLHPHEVDAVRGLSLSGGAPGR